MAQASAHAEIAAARPAETIPARSASDEPDELDLDDEVTLDDELQFFNGPACQEYRELARRFGRPEYVVDDALKLIANRPSYGVPMLRLEKLNPRNVEHARERLTRVIDENARRVREIHSVHARIKAADEARANERLAFDPSPEADKERRYIQSQERLLNQNIATIIKARKAGNDGTFAEVEIESALALDFDSNKRDYLAAISPSLAERAGIQSSAPAEESPTNTSPKRKRGSAPRQPSPSRWTGERTTKHQMPQRMKCRKRWAAKILAPNLGFCETNYTRTPPRPARNPCCRPSKRVLSPCRQVPRPANQRQRMRKSPSDTANTCESTWASAPNGPAAGPNLRASASRASTFRWLTKHFGPTILR